MSSLTTNGILAPSPITGASMVSVLTLFSTEIGRGGRGKKNLLLLSVCLQQSAVVLIWPGYVISLFRRK